MKKNNRNKISTGKIVGIVLIITIFSVVSLASAFILFYRPPVDNKVPFDTETSEITDSETSEDSNDPPLSTDPPETNKQESDNNEYTPKSEVFNFLVLGHDRVALNTDVIMLISYDVKDGKVSILQIPRDTYIELWGSRHKINSVFAAYYNKAKSEKAADPYLTALGDFASILEQNLCIKIHYYAIMDLNGFVNIVDIIGGVDMYVPETLSYSDPEQNLYISIPAGYQTLSGKQAEGLVRYRMGYVNADIGRLNAQKMFVSAFIQKVQSSLTLDNVAKITDEVLKNLTSNITAADSVYFAKSILSVDLSKIEMFTLPGNGTYVGKASYYVMNRPDTLALINSHFNIYDKEISDAIFDKNLVFVSEDYSDVKALYYNEGASTVKDEFSAQEIIDNSIDIPMLN